MVVDSTTMLTGLHQINWGRLLKWYPAERLLYKTPSEFDQWLLKDGNEARPATVWPSLQNGNQSIVLSQASQVDVCCVPEVRIFSAAAEITVQRAQTCRCMSVPQILTRMHWPRVRWTPACAVIHPSLMTGTVVLQL